ncbi:hypothetical protein E4U17_004010 [Claviceps sp. LM77 group G4]|nr:hypothetical protein E4U17_004010 [Claviceps sp. LM77 group G4]KAG6081221.1 hypothetical protein E4U16_007677 [Claviceps sp. LM84 group G4]KAG6081950.1 hypothetical protein E4U33_006235 [Claviceps sp. LM78 group G4]
MAPSRPETNKKTQSPATLLSDADTQFEVGNLDAAIALASKALDETGPGGDFELRALNSLGTLLVESGDIEEGRTYFERAITLDSDGMTDEKIGGGPEKFLFLAQLSEEGGQDSVHWFERGASTLRKQIQNLSSLPSRTPDQEASLLEKQQKLGGVLCAVAEVYMTDLSWEADAEQRCESLVTEAMMIAPNAPETWQTVANVRISQQRFDEAKKALQRSLELWQDLPAAHPDVPAFPSRIALARLLLETEMEEEALKVLERLVSDDDQSVEAWYLGGWCLYMSGEKQKTSHEPSAAAAAAATEAWKSTWSTARKWLAQCLKLYARLDYEDERLGEHAVELFQSINAELGEMPEGEEDNWEASGDEDEDVDGDEDKDEDEDEDEEMEG